MKPSSSLLSRTASGPKDLWDFFCDLVSGRRTRAELGAADQRRTAVHSILGKESLRVLDLANGRLRPQLSILEREGHSVVGIDLVNRPSWSLENTLYALARLLFRFHLPSPSPGVGRSSLTVGDVGYLPFQDSYFDLVTSIAAYEHFLDPDRVTAELARVLRLGGVAWIAVHPFTALSGGHNVSCALAGVKSLPQGVKPWDHLRERKLPFSVPLNELRPKDYDTLFSKYFQIIDRQANREGEKFVTKEILKVLTDYDEDELTSGSVIYTLQKI